MMPDFVNALDLTIFSSVSTPRIKLHIHLKCADHSCIKVAGSPYLLIAHCNREGRQGLQTARTRYPVQALK